MRWIILYVYVAASLLIGWGASDRLEKVCDSESSVRRVILIALLWPVAVFPEIGAYMVDHSAPTPTCPKKD